MADIITFLEQLRSRAHAPSQAMSKWERLIRWKVEGEEHYWQSGPKGILAASPGDAELTLGCSLDDLAKLAAGELPLFIAIWATGQLKCEGSFSDAFRLGYYFLSDRRGKRVVFLAHCFMNANTRFPGGCAFSGATEPLIQVLLESGVGIVQMPCPEYACLGLEKELYGEVPADELRACFGRLAHGVLDQVRDYMEHGYEVAGIIGMNPSPSCGVEVSKGKETMLGLGRDTSEKPEPGLFFEQLAELAQKRGFDDLPIFGVRRMLPGESGIDERLNMVRQKLKKT